MFNFFKRSKSRVEQQQACATDSTYVKNNGNRNSVPAQSIQQQYENESIGERAPTSNSSKNGFFDIMAKGRNRRNYGKNKQQSTIQSGQKQKNNETIKILAGASATLLDRSNCTKKQQIGSAQHTPPQSDEIQSKKLDSWPPESVKAIYNGKSPKNNPKYVNAIITTANNTTNNNDDDGNIHCVFNGEGDQNDKHSVRHSDQNSEQNGAAATSNHSSDTANFVKGIIFEKYKRPLSPIGIRSAIEVAIEQSPSRSLTIEDCAGNPLSVSDTKIMGQQPTKHQQQIVSNREYYRKIRTPSTTPPASPVVIASPVYTPLSTSPPETPSISEKFSGDEKDIFYEASESNTTINNTTTALIPESVEYPIIATRRYLSGEQLFEKYNLANLATDHPRDTDTFPSVGIDTVPTVVNQTDTINDYEQIIINHNANLSDDHSHQGKRHNVDDHDNDHHHDSPDSGVDIDSDTTDLSSVVTDKFQSEQHLVSISENENQCTSSAFNGHFEHLKNNSICDDGNVSLQNGVQCDKIFNTTLKSNSLSNNPYSQCEQSDDKKQQQKYDKSVHKTRQFHEDTISLPDVVVGNMGSPEDIQQNGHENGHIGENGIDKRDLVNQENKYTARIEEAEKEALQSQTKANDLACQINELERNLTIKTWNVERIQAELQAAYKEGDCVKKKLKLQEGELEKLRTKLNEAEEDFNYRYNDLEARHQELQDKLGQLQKLAMTLQIQLAEAQCDASDVRKEKDQCRTAHEIEEKRLQDALNAAATERQKLESKWQKEFEQLRTVNTAREEQLLNDCEWKIRTTEQSCKVKITSAENAKRTALDRAKEIETESARQMNEVKHLKSYEAEVAQLRGLTNEQRESINSMIQQIDELKTDLKDANKTVDESLKSVKKIKFQCEQEISDKDRQMVFKIDEARGEVAVMWEDRLLEEMARLKIELEACYAEDRAEAIQKVYVEHLEEIAKLTNSFNIKEKQLIVEIAELKNKIADRDCKLQDAKDKSDKQIMQIRVILDKSEREHQREMDSEIQKRQEAIGTLKTEYETEKQEMEEKFRERLTDVTEEFAKELTNNKEELTARHKKQLEQQWEKLMAEKEETVQNVDRTYKRKLTDADTKLRDLEITHHREMKDMKNAYAMERSSLEQRDLQNSQEIETLHRKCRCLTKLFEEMRMRYERRDPRQEDLREIEELKTRLEFQDRDLRKLTEKYRELQMIQQQHSNQQQNNVTSASRKQKSKKAQKINCDVIYEENEERESPTRTEINGCTSSNSIEVDQLQTDSDDDDIDEKS